LSRKSKMIKIAYNYQTFTHQKYGGISRMFSEIAPLINQYDDFEVTVCAGLYQNKYIENHLNIKVKGIPISFPQTATRLLLSLNPIFAKAVLEMDKPDIVHETYYSSVNTIPKKSRTVITVLDMIHEKFADSLGYVNRNFPELKLRAIKRADHIICISENTRKDLIEILDINPAKISTVYLSHSTLEATSNKPLINQPYILYVGERRALYKNFKRLLQAYGSSRSLQNNFKLVCFGSSSFSSQEMNIIREADINASNVLHYNGADSILANLYTHASAFIYPSLYEGFGIPPLEAMSLNCPVVCSNTSSIPEVVADAGEYFDPCDIDNIASAIEKVVLSSDRGQLLKSKGTERIKLFSWDKCARETSSIYKQLI
jgi:glycosyltransferase involved in cell wall biosynthesis